MNVDTVRVLDAAATPLDAVRREAMRLALRTPGLRGLLLDRDRRVGAHAALGIAAALTLTAFYPAMLFVVGPLVLGVAHVAGDLRYLLLRRSVPRGVGWMAAAFCGLLFAMRLGELTGVGPRLGAADEVTLVELWVGASVVAAGREGGRGRAALALGLVLAVGYVGQRWPYHSRLVFAHMHNVIGVALWLLLFRRRLAPALPALALLAGGIALVGTGTTLPLAERAGGLSFAGQHLAGVAAWLAPGVPLRWVAGVVLSYVFLQAIHYSVWLAWVPQEDTRAEGTTSFRMSLRSLRTDLRWLLVPIVLAAALVPLLALRFGAVLTRDVYLSLASFHGYLEVAMGAYFIVAPATLARAR